MRATVQRIFATLIVMLALSACGAPPDAEPMNSVTQPSAPASAVQPQSATTTRPGTKASFSGINFPLTVTDWYGNQTTIKTKPQRVVLLAGTAFNIWYDVGGRAVGSTNRSENIRLIPKVAEAMKPLPELGPIYSVDQETLVALNPDLVIAMGPPQDRLGANLRTMGINVISTSLRSQDDLYMAYEMFGAMNGNHDKAIQRINQMDEQIAAIKAKFPSNDPAKIAIVHVTAQALTVKLDSSIAGQMAQSLGLVNVASGRTPDAPGSEHTPLDIEYLAKNQPDIVFVTSMIANNDEAHAKMEASFAANAAWQAVDAVRNGKVHSLPQQYFLFNAGPYYPDALEYLAASIHPEIYGEPKI